MTTSPAPPPSAPMPRHHRILGGFTGWRWSYLPGVVALTAVLVGVGLLFGCSARYFGRAGRWAVLVPLGAVGLYVLLLPASI